MQLPPIFILGAPRSGTTLLLDLLSAHTEFAWISRQLDQDPLHFHHARRNLLFDLPFLGTALFQRRYQVNRLPNPVEPWNFWSTHLPGFRRVGEPPHPPQVEDIPSDAMMALSATVQQLCDIQKRSILLSKYTDFPRIRLLRAALPGARFIHLHRDPHAVAASYAKRAARGEFSEWKEKDSWKKALPEAFAETLEQVADTPLNLTGMLTRWFVQLIREEAAELPPSDYLEVEYADFTGNPDGTCGTILRHFGLPSCSRLDQYITSRDIKNMDHKWREEYDTAAQAELEIVLNG